MPKKRKVIKTKNKTRNTSDGRAKPRKNRPLLISFVILVFVILIAISGIYVNGAIQDGVVQSDMREYLQNKYGKEFVVDKPRKKADGFGVEGYLESVAYQKNDKSLKFFVRKSSTYIGDGYVGAV